MQHQPWMWHCCFEHGKGGQESGGRHTLDFTWHGYSSPVSQNDRHSLLVRVRLQENELETQHTRFKGYKQRQMSGNREDPTSPSNSEEVLKISSFYYRNTAPLGSRTWQHALGTSNPFLTLKAKQKLFNKYSCVCAQCISAYPSPSPPPYLVLWQDRTHHQFLFPNTHCKLTVMSSYVDLNNKLKENQNRG